MFIVWRNRLFLAYWVVFLKEGDGPHRAVQNEPRSHGGNILASSQMNRINVETLYILLMKKLLLKKKFIGVYCYC